MKIVAISDLHGFLDLDYLSVNCDVLCICGDIVPLEIQRNHTASWTWFNEEFLDFCERYPANRVIFCGGNHDFFLDTVEAQGKVKKYIADKYLSSKVIYLMDSGIDYMGKWFWGCPWVGGLPNWAFNTISEDHFRAIPDCDVLISHAPIPGPTGTVLQKPDYNQGRDFGSKSLFECLKGRKIQYHVCGHVHSGEHDCIEIKGTKIHNVSIKDENYEVAYKPFVFEI